MDPLLRFKSSHTFTSYSEEQHREKTEEKKLILIIFIISYIFYIIDLVFSTYKIYDGKVLTLAQMIITFSLQGLKLFSFLVYYKFSVKTQSSKSNILEFTFCILFLASFISVWDIQLNTDKSRAYVIGLEFAWILLYLDALISAWRLKVLVCNIIVVYALVKACILFKAFHIEYIQLILQIFFVVALLYHQEKRKREDFIKMVSLAAREQTLTNILDNIPENIAILGLDGKLKYFNQYLDTCFKISSPAKMTDLFLKFVDIKPRERYFDLFQDTSKSMLISKPTNRKSLVKKMRSSIGEKLSEKLTMLPSLSSKKTQKILIKETNKSFIKYDFQKATSMKNPNILMSPSSGSLTDIMTNVDHYNTLQDVLNFFCANTSTVKSYLNKQNNFFIFDGKYKGFNEKKRSFEIKVSVTNFDQDESLIVILRDTTHRDVIVTLEGNNNFKDSVISSISHELRTPLNTNLNLLDMAIGESSISTEFKNSYLLPAHQSGKLLKSLINDLLDYSLLIAKRFVPEIKDKYLLSSLEKLRYLTAFKVKSKNIEFHISISQKLNFKVWTDHRRLRQILVNLLNNAFKYTNKGFIQMKAEPYEGNNQLIKFTVIDSGIGIEPQDLERMSHILKRRLLGQKLVTKNTEIGMGLMISNLLARNLGPSDEIISGVNVISKLGEGSSFWFIIENRDKSLEKSIGLSNINASPRDVKMQELLPEHRLNESELVKGLNTLTPFANTQEDLKMPTIKRVPTSTRLETRKSRQQGSFHSETVDKSVVADDDQAEENIACMIKDDNLRRSINTVKLIREDTGLKRGVSKLFSSQYSRNLTLQAENTYKDTPQLLKCGTIDPSYKPESNQALNPVHEPSFEPLYEERMACACPEILVVDDDMFNLFTMENLIKSLHLQVARATNGEEAINTVLKRINYKCSVSCRPFRIILMDISMPVMNGFDATIKLREMMASDIAPYIPIVACTAFVGQDKEDEAYASGMEDVIIKPVTKSKLVETIKRFDAELIDRISLSSS